MRARIAVIADAIAVVIALVGIVDARADVVGIGDPVEVAVEPRRVGRRPRVGEPESPPCRGTRIPR